MFDCFHKKKTAPTDLNAQIREIHDQCVTLCKLTWLELNPKTSTPQQLAHEIERFSSSAIAFMYEKFPLTRHAPPYNLWLVVFTAVLESHTHPTTDVNKAIDLLRSKYGG